MPRNENKENDLMAEMAENGGISFPRTPAHLLKRSQSAMMKMSPPEGEDASNLMHRDCDAPVKRTSPMRKVQQGRPPLASKDSNRSSGFLFQQQKQQPLLRREPSLPKRRNAAGVDGQLLGNPRRLKKYGSVLGYNALPKMKSLVLKDVDQVGKQEDDENDDEDEDHALRLKLNNAIERSDDEGEEIGGLFNKSGLQQLIRDCGKDEDDWEDREIEYGPPKHEPLPYVPDGHLSLATEDIEKLKTFRSPYLIEDECSKSDDDDTHSGFMQLEETSSIDEDDEILERHDVKVKQRDTLPHSDTFDILPGYSGEGLSADDLNELLKD